MFTVWRDGIRRVWEAPAILLGAWAITLLVSLPFAAAMKELLQDHLGGSLAAETAASGVNFNWMEEFAEQTRGLGATFRPAVVGFAAVVDNVSAFLDGDYFSAGDDGRRHTSVLVGAAAIYILLWMFLAGGALDRYARDRITYAYGFFAASASRATRNSARRSIRSTSLDPSIPKLGRSCRRTSARATPSR